MIDELKKVFEFRKELANKGVLYRLFKNENDLTKEIRINIQRPIMDYLQNERQLTRDSPTAIVSPAERAGSRALV